jgi:dolichyl-diphosphooligosaccharide--protein glycosyltransferase
VLGAFAASLAARVLPYWHQVFRGGAILPYSDDPYYHLRRIALATKYWPRVPDFDSWISFPDGTWGIWAPLFDFVPATFARLTGIRPLLPALFLPALLGAATVFPLYALVRSLSNRRAALLSLVPFVFLPGTVLVSAFGRVDHHVAEVFFQLAFDAIFLTLVLRIEDRPSRTYIRAAGLGLIAAAALLTWAGSLLFLAVPVCVAALLSLAREDRFARAIATVVGVAFGVAAAATLPFGLANVLRGREAFAPHFLSLLQPLLCLILASVPGLLPWLRRTAGSLARATLGALLLTLVALALMAVLPSLRHGLAAGIAFVAGRQFKAWQGSILESAPLLQTARTRAYGEMNLSFLFYGLPIAALVCAARAVRDRLGNPRSLLAAVWLIQAATLPFLQIRFVYYAAPAVCALYGFLWDWTWRRGRYLGLVTAAFLSLVLLKPSLSYWRPITRPPYPTVDASLYNMLVHFRSISPPAGDPVDPWTKPSYGVLANWSLGHWIVGIAQRPAVATPFGPALEGGGYHDSVAFLEQIRDEKEAVDLLSRRQCRYVITNSNDGPVPGGGPWRSIFARRLHVENGSDAEGWPGSGRFRLLAETRPRQGVLGHPERLIGYYKLFELVPGAEIEVPAPAGRAVEVRTSVGAAARSFDYVRSAAADPDGFARIRVSYPGDYKIRVAGAPTGQAAVSRQAVEEGSRIAADSGERPRG